MCKSWRVHGTGVEDFSSEGIAGTARPLWASGFVAMEDGRPRPSTLARHGQIIARRGGRPSSICGLLISGMNQRSLLLCACIALAAAAILAAAPEDSHSKPDPPAEAARLNNLGAAYMNQQLFEKGLKAFQEAGARDPKLQIAFLNQGIALLNLARIEPAKVLLEASGKNAPNDPHA